MNIIYLIDFNCPYSYIGINRLKKAIENLNFNVEWELRSFELEPIFGKAYISAVDRYAEKLNLTTEEAEEKLIEIEKIASDDGLEMNFKDMTLRTSKDAHRLAKFVQSNHPDVALKLVEAIFHANFVENENIADNKTLIKLGVSCGLDKEEVEKIVENNYYNIEVELDKDEALSHTITATPCFIISHNGERLIIPGVFSTEEFEIALKDLDEGKINDKSFI